MRFSARFLLRTLVCQTVGSVVDCFAVRSFRSFVRSSFFLFKNTDLLSLAYQIAPRNGFGCHLTAQEKNGPRYDPSGVHIYYRGEHGRGSGRHNGTRRSHQQPCKRTDHAQHRPQLQPPPVGGALFEAHPHRIRQNRGHVSLGRNRRQDRGPRVPGGLRRRVQHHKIGRPARHQCHVHGSHQAPDQQGDPGDDRELADRFYFVALVLQFLLGGRHSQYSLNVLLGAAAATAAFVVVAAAIVVVVAGSYRRLDFLVNRLHVVLLDGYNGGVRDDTVGKGMRELDGIVARFRPNIRPPSVDVVGGHPQRRRLR